MIKQILFIPGLFVLGILVGILIMNARDNSVEDASSADVRRSDDVTIDVAQSPASTPWFATESAVSTDPDHVQTLENKVAELEARIMELEATTADGSQSDTEASSVVASANSVSRVLTTQSLLKAGLSEDVAADIVRRRNEIELRKLELRDSAAREDYLGTTRYMRELTALVEEQTTLREELGDDVYDQYLYANGQANRVKVATVMLGSSAYEAGMQEGDVVLNYGQQRIFDGMELKNVTSEGELDEYVNVDILRDGQLMSLWVPRGPLGIRFGAARVEP